MPVVPLITAQRRLTTVGEIRLGRKVPIANSNGKTRPAKIDKFRLTSSDRARLDAAAELYGGTVEAWEGRFELYTTRDAIPIAVVPNQALNVSYELWGQKTIDGKKTPVICLRRCDGDFETKSERPCLCAGEPEMQCKPTARLSVVLTEVPGLGVWKLVTHGWNAVTELQGTVELLEMLVERGHPVRARLRLDKRESAHERGMRKFVVPVIDIDHTLGNVLDQLAAPAAGLAVPEPASVGGFKPVGELPPAPASSIRDQVNVPAAPAAAPARARANAQQPIPRTGLAPRGVAELSGPGSLGEHPAGPEGGESVVPLPEADSPPTSPSSSGEQGGEPSEASTPDGDGPARPLHLHVLLAIKELEPAGLDSKASDAFRHAWLKAFSGGAYEGSKSMPIGDAGRFGQTVAAFKAGEIELGVDESGWWLDAFVTPRAAVEEPQLDLWSEHRWRAELDKVPGVGPAKLLKHARQVAGELGITVPNGLDEMSDAQLVAACCRWLAGQAS